MSWSVCGTFIAGVLKSRGTCNRNVGIEFSLDQGSWQG